MIPAWKWCVAIFSVLMVPLPVFGQQWDREKIEKDRTQVIVLDGRPEFSIREIDRQSHVTIRGRVGTLRIGKISGESTVDASGLLTGKVIIEDEISWHSDLIIATPEFRFRKIAMQSVVVLSRVGKGHIEGNDFMNESRILWYGDREFPEPIVRNGYQSNSRIVRMRITPGK